jgi:site-specific recombinase XerD
LTTTTALARPQPQPVDVTVSGGDIGLLAKSFRRSLLPTEYAPATVRIYTISVAQFADFLAARGMPLVVADITGEHIGEFLAHVLATRSAGTAETRYRGLKAFFKWALDEGEITRDPMARIKRPKQPESPPPMLSDDDVRKLLKTCEGSKDFESRRDLAMLRLLLDTGIRRSELAYIALDDVDLDSNVVRVTGKAAMGTAARTRVVPFGRKTALALDRYLRSRSAHRFARDPALWLGRQGPLLDSAVDLIVRRRAKQAGLQGVHAHLFRHGFAHAWLAQGGLEGDLMMLTGWKSRTMLSRYGASAAAERAIGAHRRLALGDRL